jgi:hypothetical protein
VTASRSLASALYEGALVRGLLRPGPSSCPEPLDRQSQSPLIMHPDPHGRHRAGVRLQIGILSGFVSEWWPASNRNTWPDSSESAADALRGLDISLPSAVRWLRRRLCVVRTLRDAMLSMAAIDLCVTTSLPLLRQALAPNILSRLPSPVGFRPP